MSVEDVTRAKSDLLAAGENLDGKCGAHKIAAQTAWNKRNDGEGWGLVHSTGSGCEINNDIYRADSLMLKDGTTKDILQYAESRDGLVYPEVDHDEYNIPTWSETGPQDPANWREPYDPGLVPESGDGGGGEQPVDDDAVAAINAHTTAETDRVIAAVDAGAASVNAHLDDLRSEVIDFCEQAGRLLIAIAVKRRLDNGDEVEP